MKKIFKVMALAMVVMLMGCSDGKSGYSAKDFYDSNDPEVARMLDRASSRCFKVKKEGGQLSLGGIGGPNVDGKKYANSSESIEEGQYAFIYHNKEKDKYYLILESDNDNHESLVSWCEENLK